jgi:WD40 repeat protein
MKNLIFSLFFFIILVTGYSQEIDLVRLNYENASGNQVGMAASANGEFIAFIYDNHVVKIFEVATNRFVKRFNISFKKILNIQITNDNKIVLIDEDVVTIWNWKEGLMTGSFAMDGKPTKSSYLSNKNLLAVGKQGGATTILDLTNNKLLNEIKGSKHHVSGLAFHPSGEEICITVIGATAMGNAPISMYDVKSGQKKKQSDALNYFTTIFYSEDGTELLASTLDAIYAFDSKMLYFKREISRFRDRSSGYNLFYGGSQSNGKISLISLEQSFNVIDYNSGELIFTTKADKNRMPAYSELGKGGQVPFPISNNGERVILNASKNNINQIYDSKLNVIVGYLFSDSSDDFAV